MYEKKTIEIEGYKIKLERLFGDETNKIEITVKKGDVCLHNSVSMVAHAKDGPVGEFRRLTVTGSRIAEKAMVVDLAQKILENYLKKWKSNKSTMLI